MRKRLYSLATVDFLPDNNFSMPNDTLATVQGKMEKIENSIEGMAMNLATLVKHLVQIQQLLSVRQQDLKKRIGKDNDHGKILKTLRNQYLKWHQI
jgi:hypothetical protein